MSNVRKFFAYQENGNIRWGFLWNDDPNELDNIHIEHFNKIKDEFNNAKIVLVDSKLASSDYDVIKNFAKILINKIGGTKIIYETRGLSSLS